MLIPAVILHGSLGAVLGDQMKKIADGATAWSVVHWVSAAALSLYAVTGLIMLSSASRLVRGWWTRTAWEVLTVSALWTMTTAVAEATVTTNAAEMRLEVPNELYRRGPPGSPRLQALQLSLAGRWGGGAA
jgi:hypothetical protein